MPLTYLWVAASSDHAASLQEIQHCLEAAAEVRLWPGPDSHIRLPTRATWAQFIKEP